MPKDGRIRIIGPHNGDSDLRRLAAQYEDLDRAFGVPDPANTGAPINSTPQRALTPYEVAQELIENVRRQTMDTATLGRLEELINALEVLYGPGVAYPLRDALGTLGAAMNHAWVDLGRARRDVADEVARLTAACDQLADDYRTIDTMAQDYGNRLADEQNRRRHAEEVLRRLEEFPGFLAPEPGYEQFGYQLSPEQTNELRTLIKAHTATVAGVPVDGQPINYDRVWQYPGPMPASTSETGPQPGPAPSTRELLADLLARFEAADTPAVWQLDVPAYCRTWLDNIDPATLDYRPGPA